MKVESYPRWFKSVPDRFRPSAPAEANPYPRWLTKIGFCVSSCLFLGLLSEWFTIGVLADPENINGYLFGTEVMMGEGSSNYASAETYALSMLMSALASLTVALIFAVAIKKNNRFYRWLAWSTVLLVFVVCNYVIAEF